MILLFFYRLALQCYQLGIRVVSPFHPKAKKWIAGRQQVFTNLAAAVDDGAWIWMHCASLGEFEQGRPVLEVLKKQYPKYKILLTFFSPSGYEVRKNYPLADHVSYLPLDTPRNAKQFLDIVQPALAIFVKYEFWYYYLTQLKQRNIPTTLVSALFQKGQPFFSGVYKSFFQEMLHCFTHIFVQNVTAQQLLSSIGIQNTTISGDTRIDRVLQISKQAGIFPIIEQFKGDHALLICGSTWLPDEEILAVFINENENLNWRFIFAPHDISKNHLQQLEALLQVPYIRYSTIKTKSNFNLSSSKVLIIDSIGILSQIYQYGTLAYIGGGFKTGLHNTLEPAAFGLPVVFGPKYQKFEEAQKMLNKGGAFSISNLQEFTAVFQQLQSLTALAQAADVVRTYLKESQGATTVVMDYLETILDKP